MEQVEKRSYLIYEKFKIMSLQETEYLNKKRRNTVTATNVMKWILKDFYGVVCRDEESIQQMKMNG